VYTSCKLTKPEKDKLRAIQGIADQIGQGTGDTYKNGFFWRHLPKALCWMTTFNQPARRVPDYRIPSWSWASMDGQISSNTTPHRQKGDEMLAACIMHVTLSHDDKDGTLGSRDGLLCIGRLLPITPSPSNDRPTHDANTWRRRSFDIGGRILEFHLDGPEEAKAVATESVPLAFFPIVAEQQKLHIDGLLLSMDRDGTFRRLGVSFDAYVNEADLEMFMRVYRSCSARSVVLV